MDAPSRLNPFPGLRPFETDEDYLFFGREAQTDELLQRLSGHRFLAVVGTSGSGKSSLVRAGLLPALQGGFMVKAGSSWRIAVMRPGNQPIENLAKELNEPEVLAPEEDEDQMHIFVLETTLRRGALGLVEVVKQARLPSSENLLIVVDQFEELFRLKDTPDREDAGEDAAAFVKLILEAAKSPEISVYVVLTMRSEFLGDCAQFRNLPETINDCQYLIPRMTRDQLKQAIASPVRVSGAEVEGGAEITPRLVNRLLNDMGDHPDQLPVLQHALMRTWDNWMGDHGVGEPIDLRHYEAIGGMAKALSQHADEIYDNLPNERAQAIAESLFRRLTDRDPYGREIRRPCLLQEICDVAEASEAKIIEVIERFRAVGCSFLMPALPAPLTPTSMLDISHESLIRVWENLKKWTEAEQASAQLYRRLAESALLYKKSQTGLITAEELVFAEKWLKKTQPNAIWAKRYNPHFEEATSYLEASKTAQARLEAERLQREELSRKKELEDQTRIIQTKFKFYLIATTIVLTTIGAALIGISQIITAQQNSTTALLKSSDVFFDTKPKNLEALDYAVKAAHSLDLGILNWLPWQSSDGKNQVLGRLLQATYGVREFNRLEGHNAAVNKIDFDQNGTIMASASDDNTIIIWDVNRKKLLREPLKGHTSRVNSVRFSPDNKKLASASDDQTIKIWNHNPKDLLIQTLGKTNKSHTGPITDVSFGRDGKTLASASDDNAVIIWKVRGKNFIFFKKLEHQNRVKALSFSPNGKELASVGWDSKIYLWDTDTDSTRPIKSKQFQKIRFTSVSFSPDGQTIAAGSLDNTIQLWHPDKNTSETLIGHTDRVTSVAFSPDNKYLVSASADGTAKIWNLSTKQIELNLEVPGILSARFSPDSSLATTDFNKKIRLWKFPEFFADTPSLKGLVTKSIKASEEFSISSIDISPNGKTIVSGESSLKSSKGQVVLYNLQDQHKINVLKTQCKNIKKVQFSSSNSKILSFAENCSDFQNSKRENNDLISIEILNQNNSKKQQKIAGQIQDFSFSQNGKWIVIASNILNNRGAFNESKLSLWDLNKNLLKPIPVHGIQINSVQFNSNDSQKIILGRSDGKIQIFNLSNLQYSTSFLGHTDGITSLKFNPNDPTQFVSGSYDTNIRLWNLSGDKKDSSQVLGSHDSSIKDLDFSQNGQWLVSSSTDGTIKFWSLKDKTLIGTLKRNSTSIVGVSFSPDRSLTSFASNKEILLWNSAFSTLARQSCNWLDGYLEAESKKKCHKLKY